LNGGGGAPVKKSVNQELTPGEIAAGSVHLVVWDGTNFQLLSQLFDTSIIAGPIGGIGESFGLVITNDSFTPDEILVITADAVILQNASGDDFQSNAVNVSLDITTTGLGGLDTGSATADTWYYVWLLSNGTSTDGVFSLSSTAPTLPSGYTFKALLGTVRTNSTIDLRKIWQIGRKTFIETQTLSKGADGPQDFSTVIPPIALTVFGSTFPTGGPNADTTLILAGNSTLIGSLTLFFRITAGNVISIGGYFETPLITPQTVYATSTVGLGVDFLISGFTL
jgi:hypothetical protein